MKLWTNGVFHTLQTKHQITHQVLTDNGYIIALGDEANNFSFDEIIDLKGLHVYPGFIDTHLHLVGYGRKLSLHTLKLNDSKFQALLKIKAFFNDEPLFVEGYFNTGITKFDLDLISSTYPIIIRHNDYHSFTVNSYVLNLLNIVHVDGIMLEKESQHIMPLWSKFSKADLLKMTEGAIKKLHSYGITAILSDDLSYFNSYDETLDVIIQSIDTYPLRTHLLIHEDILDIHLKKDTFKHPLLSFDAVKTFYDGTLSSKSAKIKAPYKDSNHFGDYIHTKADFIKIVKKVRENHKSLAIHTIGDEALDDLLNILKAYPPTNKKPDRIIHASLASHDMIHKMKDMPIVLDIQPQFIASDLPWAKDLLTHHPLIYPIKSYMKSHIRLGFSSDAPVEEPNPLLGIIAACYRDSKFDHRIYDKDERISRKHAIKSYTINAALSLGYKDKGLIKKGYMADFTVLSKDLIKAYKYELLEKDLVCMTIISENIVYTK